MKEVLTPAEWVVMNALWERSPATLSETIAQIGDRASWNYKTFSAYMAILEKKGFLTAQKRGRDKFYSPAVTKKECIERESKSVLDKIEAGSVKLMVTSMVRAGNLKKEDREELLAMLEALLKEEVRREDDH
ncbi:MAG: BlaI/MecI/CopY family transcriptional regulator [Clostridiaceae bacterium]|nr:BlaI/MecI/CopY family transcriptional regulator [Eubacteriales bacterium]